MRGTSSLIDPVSQDGLTCVCCSCQRERDQFGEWHDHTPQAGERLTHGICPECIHDLYPDIAPLVCGR